MLIQEQSINTLACYDVGMEAVVVRRSSAMRAGSLPISMHRTSYSITRSVTVQLATCG